MKIITSKYDGTCKVTGETYAAGTEIASIPSGWMIARYTTVEGIREWAEAQKTAMQNVDGIPAAKMEMYTRKMDAAIETLTREWNSAMRGIITPQRLTTDITGLVEHVCNRVARK